MVCKLKAVLLSRISQVIVLIAVVVASSASWWIFYQPKAPKRIF